jgi:hypothetical protein
LFKFETKADAKCPSWFTCACLAYSSDTGEEFIAVGTSNGTVYRVDVGAGCTNFIKE